MKKLMVLVAALCMVATSAYAADWNFYGSARVFTFVTETETVNTAGGVDTESLGMGLQGNSRIGATVKVSDELTGGFEYGTGVNVRKLYGEWNFGPGTFLVGQTYTPMNWFYSNQVFGSDNDMLAQGGVYSGRAPMLRLKFGGFEIAAVSPSTSDLIGGSTIEVDLPAIEAKYSFKFEGFSMDLAGAYNSYEMTNAGTSYDVDSYAIALGGSVNYGSFYFAADVITGENAGALVAISVDGDNTWNDGFAAISGNQVLDNDFFGFNIVAAWTANDMFRFEAGYGYAETELDGATTEDEVSTYYIQATVTLAPGVFFVPEIGRFDGEEAGDNETTYYGIKWQINF